MTTAAILQPGYLPWLGFFEQMWRADIFVYLDDVQYTKNDWRNRNRVKTASGPTWLTVPVVTKGKLGESLRLAPIADDGWARRHHRTVATAYARAPFIDLAAGLYAIWSDPPTSLLALDLEVLAWCRTTLGLTTPTVLASDLAVRASDASERLVRICQEVAATRFYEGASGASYLNVELFNASGIEVEFQAYAHPVYPQLHSKLGFISHLSALDLILNAGPDALSILSGQLPCDQ